MYTLRVDAQPPGESDVNAFSGSRLCRALARRPPRPPVPDNLRVLLGRYRYRRCDREPNARTPGATSSRARRARPGTGLGFTSLRRWRELIKTRWDVSARIELRRGKAVAGTSPDLKPCRSNGIHLTEAISRAPRFIPPNNPFTLEYCTSPVGRSAKLRSGRRCLIGEARAAAPLS